MRGVIRGPMTWHLILADLALILFLITAAALQNETLSRPEASVTGEGSGALAVQPSQALYRAGPGLVTLEQWLDAQPRDPRAGLTIVAQHAPGEADKVWNEARKMSQMAIAKGIRARVIIREASPTDLYASMAYDQPVD